MHPVEHALYFSCFLVALLFPYHPLHLLMNKYHTDISALGGHDGYGPALWPREARLRQGLTQPDRGQSVSSRAPQRRAGLPQSAPAIAVRTRAVPCRRPPGADDAGHYLHHAHFECNYGFSFPNYLDRLLGTYDDGTRWQRKARAKASKAPRHEKAS